MQALICSEASLDRELAATMLYRSNVTRHHARTLPEAKAAVKRLRLEIVLVDRDFPGAATLARELREDPETRRLSLVALARGDFASSELVLLEAGMNAVLRLPPSGDWDDRLFRLMHVPVRRQARVPVHLRLDLGLGATGETFAAEVLNLSVNGLLIESGQSLEVGSDITFSFELPNGGGRVEGGATVVRHASSPRQYGAELTSVKGDGRVRLKRWVEGL